MVICSLCLGISPDGRELSSHVCCNLHQGGPASVVQGARGADALMEDAEESAAGPEAMAAAEAAREAGMRARNQGRRNFNPRTMEALVEDMIEQAYAGDGLEVSEHCVCNPAVPEVSTSALQLAHSSLGLLWWISSSSDVRSYCQAWSAAHVGIVALLQTAVTPANCNGKVCFLSVLCVMTWLCAGLQLRLRRGPLR